MKHRTGRFIATLTITLLAVGVAPGAEAENSKQDAAPASRQVVYKQTPQGELTIEVFYPKDWKATDRRAGIVFFFGGGWTNGNRSQFVPQCQYLASRGMVAATADYRIRSKHKTSPVQCVEDAKSAVRWMRKHAGELGIDPDKLAAGGGSAGGHLAAATALCDGYDAADEDKAVSSRPNALVLFNPVTDMTGMPERLAGEPDPAAAAKAISPVLGLKKDSPPAVLFFGTADRLAGHGDAYLKRAAEVGARAELYTAEAQPHGFFNRNPWQQATVREADRFLASIGYLEGEPTIAVDAKATLKHVKAEKAAATSN